MSGAGWTPGPWEVAAQAEGMFYICGNTKSGGQEENPSLAESVAAHVAANMVALCESEPDAHLIAAAPAMARALEAQEELSAAYPDGPDDPTWPARFAKLRDRADRLRASALRSARGGSGGE